MSASWIAYQTGLWPSWVVAAGALEAQNQLFRTALPKQPTSAGRFERQRSAASGAQYEKADSALRVHRQLRPKTAIDQSDRRSRKRTLSTTRRRRLRAHSGAETVMPTMK